MAILYVAEDSPAQQELVRAALLDEDLQLTFYSDGGELYQAVVATPPDMLILDIIMPTLNGVAITWLLKHHDDYRGIPILVMSSIIDADIRERVERAGAEMFLPKPYEPERLVEAVGRLLEGACRSLSTR